MDLMKTLRKWWILSTALLVVTIIATLAALVKLPWTYSATANVVFLPSQNLAKQYGGNPYLAFNATINETADVIRYQTTDYRTAQALAAKGYTAGYTITDALDTSAPVLLITATGSSPNTVANTLTGVTQEVTALLSTQQADFSPANQVHDEIITTSHPTRLTSKKARPLLAVFIVGLLFTIGLTVIVDAVSGRRRGNKSRTRSTSASNEITRSEEYSGQNDGYSEHYRETADQQSTNYLGAGTGPKKDGPANRQPDQRSDYSGQGYNRIL